MIPVGRQWKGAAAGQRAGVGLGGVGEVHDARGPPRQRQMGLGLQLGPTRLPVVRLSPAVGALVPAGGTALVLVVDVDDVVPLGLAVFPAGGPDQVAGAVQARQQSPVDPVPHLGVGIGAAREDVLLVHQDVGRPRIGAPAEEGLAEGRLLAGRPFPGVASVADHHDGALGVVGADRVDHRLQVRVGGRVVDAPGALGIALVADEVAEEAVGPAGVRQGPLGRQRVHLGAQSVPESDGVQPSEIAGIPRKVEQAAPAGPGIAAGIVGRSLGGLLHHVAAVRAEPFQDLRFEFLRGIGRRGIGEAGYIGRAYRQVDPQVVQVAGIRCREEAVVVGTRPSIFPPARPAGRLVHADDEPADGGPGGGFPPAGVGRPEYGQQQRHQCNTGHRDALLCVVSFHGPHLTSVKACPCACPASRNRHRYTPLATACPPSSRPSQVTANTPAGYTPSASVLTRCPIVLWICSATGLAAVDLEADGGAPIEGIGIALQQARPVGLPWPHLLLNGGRPARQAPPAHATPAPSTAPPVLKVQASDPAEHVGPVVEEVAPLAPLLEDADLLPAGKPDPVRLFAVIRGIRSKDSPSTQPSPLLVLCMNRLPEIHSVPPGSTSSCLIPLSPSGGSE